MIQSALTSLLEEPGAPPDHCGLGIADCRFRTQCQSAINPGVSSVCVLSLHAALPSRMAAIPSPEGMRLLVDMKGRRDVAAVDWEFCELNAADDL
jgi:hypothetical protein